LHADADEAVSSGSELQTAHPASGATTTIRTPTVNTTAGERAMTTSSWRRAGTLGSRSSAAVGADKTGEDPAQPERGIGSRPRARQAPRSCSRRPGLPAARRRLPTWTRTLDDPPRVAAGGTTTYHSRRLQRTSADRWWTARVEERVDGAARPRSRHLLLEGVGGGQDLSRRLPSSRPSASPSPRPPRPRPPRRASPWRPWRPAETSCR
jgi:hypothetical protein